MISPQQKKVLRISDFIAEQKGYCPNALFASVNVIPKE